MKKITLDECIDSFIGNEISATEIENMVNKGQIVFDCDSIEYGKKTKNLNRLLFDRTGEGVQIPVDANLKEMFIATCKAIETRTKFSEIYEEK